MSPPTATPGNFTYNPNLPQRLSIHLFKAVNRFIPWHKLSPFLDFTNIGILRYELRHKNLHDVYPSPSYQRTPGCPHLSHDQYLHTRHLDGLFNDLAAPKMGCAGMRFGRNVPRAYTQAPTEQELMTPNPKLISAELLQRDYFKPATTLNLLAAAWIQCLTHDWFQHANSKTDRYDVELPVGDN
jgi:hypothetical protein